HRDEVVHTGLVDDGPDVGLGGRLWCGHHPQGARCGALGYDPRVDADLRARMVGELASGDNGGDLGGVLQEHAGAIKAGELDRGDGHHRSLWLTGHHDLIGVVGAELGLPLGEGVAVDGVAEGVDHSVEVERAVGRAAGVLLDIESAGLQLVGGEDGRIEGDGFGIIALELRRVDGGGGGRRRRCRGGGGCLGGHRRRGRGGRFLAAGADGHRQYQHREEQTSAHQSLPHGLASSRTLHFTSMERRIFGLENEYGVTCTLRGQRRLSPDEVARYLFRRVVSWGRSSNVFLENGARLYLDVGSHPEYATPECDSIHDLVVHDKAGERILEGLVQSAEQRLREEGIRGEVFLFKNNTDSAGNSYGCHENYLVEREGDFSKFTDVLIPYLVTRQIYAGAGKVLQTARGAMYCIAQRAEHIWEGVSSATTRSRPIINTRDEPHADAERFR